MNTPPRKESETGLYAPVWRKINSLIDYMREISVVHGRNVRVSRTMNGTLLTGIAESVQSFSIRQFVIKSIENDFYTCRTWDGSNAGSADIFVARPFEHRVSQWNGRSVNYSSDGDVFTATYSYSSTTKRTKTVAGTAEVQVLVPYFKTDLHLIYAVPASGLTIPNGSAYEPLLDPNDSPVTLLDLNIDGRAWAKLE